ncbi:holin [Macrococcoides goetzii]|nr:phage holin family protein [Macrococcus goetzii]TDM41842.1 holin [Macrococcus goetzii]
MIIEADGISLENLSILKFYLLGTDLRMIYILVAFMTFDIMTGIFKAWQQHNLWSRKSMFGYSRKLLIFGIVIMANLMDQILELDGMLSIATILYYIGNEGLSIVENLVILGVPVPDFFAEKLAILADGKRSITTDIKEEFSSKNTVDLPGGELEVKVKVEPEEIKNMNSKYGPEVFSNGKRTDNEV